MDRELIHDRIEPDARGSRTSPVGVRREEVVDFDPYAVKAPFLLRCTALFIDYIVFITIPVLSLVISKVIGESAVLPGTTTWLLTTLVAISNFIILPLVTSQSVGKMLTGLRITASDGNPASTVAILLRNVVGYLITVVTGGLGFLLAGITPKGRALHDYVSGTTVIYAKRRQL